MTIDKNQGQTKIDNNEGGINMMMMMMNIWKLENKDIDLN